MAGKTFTYAAAPESRAVVDLKPSYGLFIDGAFVDTLDGTAFKTVNPADEEVLAEITAAGPRDVDRGGRRGAERVHEDVVEAAGGASAASTSSGSRASCRSAHASSPCSRRSTTASRSASRATSTSPLRRLTSSTTRDGPTSWSTRARAAPRPLGVVGQVIPWNFPLLMLAWKVAPALACGNTVVLKPAETTPLTALLFAEICQQADLPPGVVNIVTGAGETGQSARRARRCRQGRVHGLHRGRQADRAVPSRASGKRVSLELGGKGANIVFDDAPVDQAVEGIVNGIFFNQGHVCCAGSRLLVQESVADDVVDRLKRRLTHAPPRRPAGQEHRHRRDQLRRAAGSDPRPVRHRRRRGR